MNKRFARRVVPLIVAGAMTVQTAAARPAAAAPMSTDCAPSSSSVLRLYVINGAFASSQTLDSAIQETSAIWGAAGLRLTWASPPAPLDLTDHRTVVVMIQRGLKRPGYDMPLLGQVPFGEDGPGNFIQVSFETITALVMNSSYLNRPVVKLPDFVQQVLLGRGLGRVVAHEIGHWLAGHGHSREGLMRPAFSGRDLVDWNAPRLPRAWRGCQLTSHGD